MFSRLFAKRKETDVALDALLLSILEDPEDHAELLYIEHAEILYNPRRRVAYAVRDNIPVMLPDEATPVSDEQHDAYANDPTAVRTGAP